MYFFYLITMSIFIVFGIINKIPYQPYVDSLLVLSVITGFAYVIGIIEKKGK